MESGFTPGVTLFHFIRICGPDKAKSMFVESLSRRFDVIIFDGASENKGLQLL
jgi:hypothetical protein